MGLMDWPKEDKKKKKLNGVAPPAPTKPQGYADLVKANQPATPQGYSGLNRQMNESVSRDFNPQDIRTNMARNMGFGVKNTMSGVGGLNTRNTMSGVSGVRVPNAMSGVRGFTTQPPGEKKATYPDEMSLTDVKNVARVLDKTGVLDGLARSGQENKTRSKGFTPINQLPVYKAIRDYASNYSKKLSEINSPREASANELPVDSSSLISSGATGDRFSYSNPEEKPSLAPSGVMGDRFSFPRKTNQAMDQSVLNSPRSMIRKGPGVRGLAANESPSNPQGGLKNAKGNYLYTPEERQEMLARADRIEQFQRENPYSQSGERRGWNQQGEFGPQIFRIGENPEGLRNRANRKVGEDFESRMLAKYGADQVYGNRSPELMQEIARQPQVEYLIGNTPMYGDPLNSFNRYGTRGEALRGQPDAVTQTQRLKEMEHAHEMNKETSKGKTDRDVARINANAKSRGGSAVKKQSTKDVNDELVSFDPATGKYSKNGIELSRYKSIRAGIENQDYNTVATQMLGAAKENNEDELRKIVGMIPKEDLLNAKERYRQLMEKYGVK